MANFGQFRNAPRNKKTPSQLGVFLCSGARTRSGDLTIMSRAVVPLLYARNPENTRKIWDSVPACICLLTLAMAKVMAIVALTRKNREAKEHKMNIRDETVMVVEYSWGTYYETGARIWIEGVAV